MEKIYVGKLTMADRMSNASVTEKTELRFVNGELRFDDPFKLRQEYYVVKKSDLDAYMDRKESLEQMNCTPVWDENQRLTAKVKALEAENAYLTRINEDFFKERSKLVEENEALVKRNTKLKCMVDKFYGMTSVGEELRAANEKLITENNKLRGENVKLRLDLKLIRDSIDAATLREKHVYD